MVSRFSCLRINAIISGCLLGIFSNLLVPDVGELIGESVHTSKLLLRKWHFSNYTLMQIRSGSRHFCGRESERSYRCPCFNQTSLRATFVNTKIIIEVHSMAYI